MSIYDRIAEGVNPGQGAVNAALYKKQEEQNALARQMQERQMGLQEKAYGLKEKAFQSDQAQKLRENVAKAIAWADTPEKWQQAVQHYQSQGMQIPPEYANVNNENFDQVRSSALASLMTPAQVADRAMPEPSGYAAQLVYYRDPKTGELQAAQVSKDGGVKPVSAPGGGQWVKPYTFRDLGGEDVAIPYGSPMPEVALPKTLKPGEQPQVQGDQAGAKKAAQLAADKASKMPKAQAALRKFQNKTEFVINQIDKARDLIGVLTTGYGATLANLPATDARKLSNVLQTIKANIGFRELQEMRDNSPTGGALGQVSEKENDLLQSIQGRLDQGMSGGDLAEVLASLEEQLLASSQSAREAFSQDYGKSDGNTQSNEQPRRLKFNPETGEFE